MIGLLNRVDVFLNKNYKKILIITLIIQTVIFCLMYIKNGVIYAVDTSSYVEPAKDFISNGTMRDSNGIPSLTRTPGYILFIALVYVLTNNNDVVIIFLQVLMCLSITYMIYYVVDKLVKNKSLAVIAPIFYISDLAMYQNGLSILTDTMFPFLLVLSLLLLVKYLDNKKESYLYLSFLTVNYALAVRPQIMYLSIILNVLLLILVATKKIPLRFFIVYFTLFSIIFFGWSYRNYLCFNKFTYTPIRSRDYFLYYAPYTYQQIQKVDYSTAQKYFFDILYKQHPNVDSMFIMDQVDAMSAIGIDYVKKHLFEFIIVNFKGLFLEMIGPNLSTIDNFNFSKIIKGIIAIYCSGMLLLSYLIYAFSFLKTLYKQKRIDWFILLCVMYLMASTAVVGYSRYRLAFYPLCLIGTFSCYKNKDC